MKLQRGRIIINNIDEINNSSSDIKDVIDLAYMGQFEFEGNVIPVSRMFIEYNVEDYKFYPMSIFNQNNQQMYIYCDSKLVDSKSQKNNNFLYDTVKNDIDKNVSLWEYINLKSNDNSCNFWWNVNHDYFILFGEEHKIIIEEFIKSCYERDGGKEEIKRKLLSNGYKI